MSLQPGQVKVFKDSDSLLKVNSDPTYVIKIGASDLTYTPFSSQSFSDSNAQFTVNPASGKTGVNRLMYLRVPFTLTFTGTSVGPTLLQLGSNDALRSFALSKVISNMKLQIDNASANIDLEDVMPAWERYMSVKTKENDLGMIPSMSDQYPQYVQYQQFGSAKNALGNYGESGFGSASPRGGYANLQVISDNGTTAVVQCELIEPIWVSPLKWKNGNDKALILTNQIQLFIQFGSLSRLWSHATSQTIGGVSYTGGENITSIVGTVGASNYDNPALLVNQVEFPANMPVPLTEKYNYHDVQIYSTQGSTSVAPGATQTIVSNNIQLGNTPKRMYVFATRTRATRTYETTDTFGKINGISIRYNNRNGILADAAPVQLYNIAVKNGYQGDYNAWSKFSGGVLALDFGEDIPLSETNVPGSVQQSQIAVSLELENIDPVDTITYGLYLVVIYEGVAIKSLNNTQLLTGTVSVSDVLNAPELPESASELLELQNPYGGSFLGKLRTIGSKAYEFGKKAAPYLKTGFKVGKKGYDYLKEHPQVAIALAPLLAAGIDENEAMKMIQGEGLVGGSVFGGKIKCKPAMRKRLKKY